MGMIGRCFDRFDIRFDGWLETGTLRGEGADWLYDWVAPRGVTIDCIAWGYQRAGVRVVVGDSATVLPDVLLGCVGRYAFWLDAHYPGIYRPDSQAESLPLQAELNAIRDWSAVPGNQAWVWVDDARIYGYAAASGPLPPDYAPGTLDLSRWTDSHTVTVRAADEGYLILTPR